MVGNDNEAGSTTATAEKVTFCRLPRSEVGKFKFDGLDVSKLQTNAPLT